ncbi:MAG: TonB-dependent receptor [Acidobacteria bacterium]|nr:TonB-dependent receptor [Acidobacteriota bacterium]
MPTELLPRCGALLLVALAGISPAPAQQTGRIRGTVTIRRDDEPIHAARITLSPSGRSTDSDQNGNFEFTDVRPGSYDLVASSPGLAGTSARAVVLAGETATVALTLDVAPIRESVTVTATGREEIVTKAIQPVTVLDMTQLPIRASTSLGEVLQDQPGISKRSSGPGNGRPVIRGFDGDRVMIMKDGISTGSLSFQSGDHGEPIDVTQLEQLDVVRGPATLLYGSSAIGGVVNAISRHDRHHHAEPGVRGFLNGMGGTANAMGGGSGGFEIGKGKWELWASGGGQRTGDYNTPLRKVLNSETQMTQTDTGLGYYGDKVFATFDLGVTRSEYGVPFDPDEEDPEIPTLELRRESYRGTVGVRDVGMLDNITARVNYSNYHHDEVVDNEVETSFFNKQTIYRVTFDQKTRGPLTGTFGFSGRHRDYKTAGEEAIAPPTTNDNFAVFAVEGIDFESRTRLQFGGRVEHNRYSPTDLQDRSFTGFSGSAGASQGLWQGGALAVNYTHSYRAPALEELYNNGPHPGNQTFEIGNPNLSAERNNGIDVSLRHASTRARAELSYFYYRFSNFVYFAPTGEVDDGLPVADYAQANSRFRGFEAKLDLALHPNLWLNLGSDAVNARLTAGDTPLPRIPPVRGRAGVDFRYKGLSIKPEVVMANAQKDVFTTETPTAGYVVVNMLGSYTIPLQHQIHVLSVNFFNAGDTLYRNHLSFLKSFAPEIGRGVRVSYSIQFF